MHPTEEPAVPMFIYFTVRGDDWYEVRSVDVSSALFDSELSLSEFDATCVATNNGNSPLAFDCTTLPADVAFRNVSVRDDGLRILVSGNDASEADVTYIRNDSFVLLDSIDGIDGNDWMPNGHIIGSQGNSIVDYDPIALITVVLLARKAQTPDWIN